MLLAPGHRRVVRQVECPPHMLARPNAYWMLRRASRRLYESTPNFVPAAIRELADAIEILRKAADELEKESKPCHHWVQYNLGTTYEICCPACSTLFEATGDFYAPQCPNCKGFLREKGKGE